LITKCAPNAKCKNAKLEENMNYGGNMHLEGEEMTEDGSE